MASDNLITSLQNPKIKRLVALQQKSSERRSSGIFVVEGIRELLHCLETGYVIDTLFYCSEIMGNTSEVQKIYKLAETVRSYQVTKEVYAKIAYRDSTEGVMAEVQVRTLSLHNLHLPENPLIVVLESVEKPGNLGAILRSADAAAADAVIVCDPLTDLFNPNLIRSSLGAFFSVPCLTCSSQ